MTDAWRSCQRHLKNIKNQVALADRNSEMAKDNHDKLEKFIMDIK